MAWGKLPQISGNIPGVRDNFTGSGNNLAGNRGEPGTSSRNLGVINGTVSTVESDVRASGNTECEAIEMAINLTAEEYSEAKMEIEMCSTVLWNDAKESFKRAAERNIKVKSRGHTS